MTFIGPSFLHLMVLQLALIRRGLSSQAEPPSEFPTVAPERTVPSFLQIEACSGLMHVSDVRRSHGAAVCNRALC